MSYEQCQSTEDIDSTEDFNESLREISSHPYLHSLMHLYIITRVSK